MRRRLYYPLILVVLLATTALGSSYSYNTFDLVDEVTHDGLFRDVEKALLSNEANPLKLRRAFYYSPTAAPVLLKVVYNISFGNNLTNAFDLSDLTSCDTRPNEDSQTLIDSEPQEVTYGWTSSGVYTLFHPLVLSAIQALIPFAAMRIVHLTVNRRSPEADTFLWDGSYELPTLPLDIHFTSLSCIPSQEQLEFVLSDINTLLKIYAGQQNTFKFLPEHHMIGFTLPSISVSKTITPSQSDLTLVNLYSASLCFTYGVGMVLFIVLYYKNTVYEETISEHLKQNEDIYAGLLITTVTALAIEMVTRFVQCMVWTAYIDNFSGTFLTVWLPQGDIFFMATFINICGHIFTYIHEYCKERPKRSDIIWTVHLSSMHAILPLALITFGLLYTLIPAVI